MLSPSALGRVTSRIAASNWSAEFTTEREAVACVAGKAVGGMRFHNLRHSYATWLVTDGVPINLVQRVMGHEQASTTLNRYTHTPDDYADRVLAAFADPAASLLPLRGESDTDGDPNGAKMRSDQGGSACPERATTPAGGRRGSSGVRLRGGRAEPTQRSRGVQPPRACRTCRPRK
ncbi:tyrosine-type recombinase/integrase [Micromonospora sp. NPDC049679]|uniref:tyrosine-type recombinase/integrase n=1 Tax=Micromonospora sp. NPDC049679 TaxID=3155920 RepID=UPI0033D2C88D